MGIRSIFLNRVQMRRGDGAAKADRVLDVPAPARWMPAGKSAGVDPGRKGVPSFGWAKPLEALPGKTSKLQSAHDRTANRHRWAS